MKQSPVFSFRQIHKNSHGTVFSFLIETFFMSDDRTKRSGQDRTRVSGGQDWEVSYMTQKYNVSKQQVEEAVKAVGNSREKVEEYLQRNRKGK
jgi:hypothetical protein